MQARAMAELTAEVMCSSGTMRPGGQMYIEPELATSSPGLSLVNALSTIASQSWTGSPLFPRSVSRLACQASCDELDALWDPFRTTAEKMVPTRAASTMSWSSVLGVSASTQPVAGPTRFRTCRTPSSKVDMRLVDLGICSSIRASVPTRTCKRSNRGKVARLLGLARFSSISTVLPISTHCFSHAFRH